MKFVKNRISILITTDGLSPYYGECVNALKKQIERGDELIIVYRNTIQFSKVKYEKRSRLTRWFWMPGISAEAAKCFAASHARGDILLFINDDCVVSNKYISFVRRAAYQNRPIIYQGRIKFLFPFNNLIKDMFSHDSDYSWYQAKKQTAWKAGRVINFFHSECYYLPRSLFEKIQSLFHPNHVPLGNGAELCSTLHHLGYAVAYSSALNITHFKDDIRLITFLKKVFRKGLMRGFLFQSIEKERYVMRQYKNCKLSQQIKVAILLITLRILFLIGGCFKIFSKKKISLFLSHVYNKL